MCLPDCDIDGDGDSDTCWICIPLMCIIGYCCCKKCGNKSGGRQNDYLPPGGNYPPGGPSGNIYQPPNPSGYPGGYPAGGYAGAGPQYTAGYPGQQGYPQPGNDYPQYGGGAQPYGYPSQQPGYPPQPPGYPSQAQAFYPQTGHPQDYKQQGSSIVNFVQ